MDTQLVGVAHSRSTCFESLTWLKETSKSHGTESNDRVAEGSVRVAVRMFVRMLFYARARKSNWSFANKESRDMCRVCASAPSLCKRCEVCMCPAPRLRERENRSCKKKRLT